MGKLIFFKIKFFILIVIIVYSLLNVLLIKSYKIDESSIPLFAEISQNFEKCDENLCNNDIVALLTENVEINRFDLINKSNQEIILNQFYEKKLFKNILSSILYIFIFCLILHLAYDFCFIDNKVRSNKNLQETIKRIFNWTQVI